MYPNLRRKKVYPLLEEFCTPLKLVCPKPVTIGRTIKDKGGLRTFPQRTNGKGKILKKNRRKILRKPKDLKAEHPDTSSPSIPWSVRARHTPVHHHL